MAQTIPKFPMTCHTPKTAPFEECQISHTCLHSIFFNYQRKCTLGSSTSNFIPCITQKSKRFAIKTNRAGVQHLPASSSPHFHTQDTPGPSTTHLFADNAREAHKARRHDTLACISMISLLPKAEYTKTCIIPPGLSRSHRARRPLTGSGK